MEVWSKLIEQKTVNTITVSKIWTGLHVWIERPHLVNRKLLAAELFHSSLSPPSRQNLCLDFCEEDFQNFLYQYESDYSNENFTSKQHNVLTKKSVIENSSITKSLDGCIHPIILIRKLIPRNTLKFSEVLELVVIDKKMNIVIFWPRKNDVIKSPITQSFPYRIMFEDNWICIETYKKKPDSDIRNKVSEEWLKSYVFPKIINWSNFPCSTTIIPSLSLVSVKSYSIKYNYLKEKYARNYIKMWPEVSDPLKCVYEDIAIAAYLITIWEKEERDLNFIAKQTFVDLGCGNGLLVDILNSEGYNGIGIDVRRRKIWDLYQNSASLIEKTIEPSNYNIFPEHDWIIGNHSDELTPWIPVIAARSSYKMRVFLLPCCAFTFNGKYERCSAGKTHYQSYLSFIHNLCEVMGFVVKVDRLRIPSTRRICFLCTSRNYEEENEENINVTRNNFIRSFSRKNELEFSISKTDCKDHRELKVSTSNTENMLEAHWIKDFKPRNRVEKVKNCSQLDRKFLDSFVLTIAKFLLQTENYIPLLRGSDVISWNAGGKIQISELIAKVDSQILRQLKNQNGGIQTFLRNHRNVFQIIDKNVQLNVPVKGKPLNSQPTGKRNHRKKEYNFQEKPCFFFFHHPQGCPLEAADCNFSHQNVCKMSFE